MKPVSVILPTFNERGNIIPLIQSINKEFAPSEIIVIDDNSPDGTFDLLLRHKKSLFNVKAVKNIPPLGLTKSIQKGINLAGQKYIAWMDADFSHPPQVLNNLYREKNRADIVIASWLTKDGKDLRKEKLTILRSFLINKLCQVLFGKEVTAYTSGFAMARKSVFADFKFCGDYGEYFIDFIVRNKRRGKKILEVPFYCFPRKAGISKTSPNIFVFLKRSINYLLMIFSLLLLKSK